MRIGHHRTT